MSERVDDGRSPGFAIACGSERSTRPAVSVTAGGVGVLLLTDAEPARAVEAASYAASVSGGEPDAALLDALGERYAALGGSSPHVGHLGRQRAGLEAALARRSIDAPVELALAHAGEGIAGAMARVAAAGVADVIVVPMTPQPVAAALDAACRELEAAAERVRATGRPLTFELISAWHTEARLVSALASATYEALDALWSAGSSSRPNVDWALGSKVDNPVVFVAPLVLRRDGTEDVGYRAAVVETAELVAERVGTALWSVAYLAAAGTEPAARSLPRLADALAALADRGERDVVVAPVASLADGLDVLYGVDVEGQVVASRFGMTLERARSLNDDPVLVAALADVVAGALAGRAPVAEHPGEGRAAGT